MTEHLPDVDQLRSKESFYTRFVDMWFDLIDSRAKHTLRYTRTSILFAEADQEIARLRIALTGISTCSTCEACRGAATLALGAPSTTGEGAK